MSDTPETTDVESPSPRSIARYAVIGIAVMVLAALAVIVVLTLLGPATSTMYPTIMNEL